MSGVNTTAMLRKGAAGLALPFASSDPASQPKIAALTAMDMAAGAQRRHSLQPAKRAPMSMATHYARTRTPEQGLSAQSRP
jgi:hypothetical protein